MHNRYEKDYVTVKQLINNQLSNIHRGGDSFRPLFLIWNLFYGKF